MLHAAGDLDGGEMFAVSAAIAAEHDHGLTGVIAGTPIPIVLVTADGFRQPVFGTDEVDGAGLPVTVREDGGGGALGRRQTEINLGNRTSHFFPSELVREILRKHAGPLVF